MNWNETFGPSCQPDSEAISSYINCPYWDDLLSYLEETYGAASRTEYSRCSGKPRMERKIQERQPGNLHTLSG